MTTIAYDIKTNSIAYDSRTTRDGYIVTDSCDKRVSHKGVEFFLSGSVCDFSMAIDAYFGASLEVVPDVLGFVVDGSTIQRIGFSVDGCIWKTPLTNSDAIGSGTKWAIAAMDFMQDAAGAVAYAATRDIHTGGAVCTYYVPG